MSLQQHLVSRQLDMNLHRVWLDADVATFPLWNLSGQLVGYQQYKPSADKKPSNDPRSGRYFTRRRIDVTAVWGLESWSLSHTLFVCEGIFDAAAFTARGYRALAVCSNDIDRSLKLWFNIIKASRKIVCICDSDAAGSRLARYGHCAYTFEQGDAGSACDQHITDIIRRYV